MNYNGTVLVTARSLKLVDDPLINQILRLKEAEVDWYQCAKMA